MAVKHPFSIESDDWTDISEGLEDEERLAMLAMDEGVIENGTVEAVNPQDLYLGPADRVMGRYLVIPPSVAADIWNKGPVNEKSVLFTSDQRNDAEFYLGSKTGSPVELKYDENIPDSENWHSHSSFEAYAPENGTITLGLIKDFKELDYAEEQISPGKIFVVPPYVQHKVVDKQNDPDLAVTRYGAEKVAKFDLEGNPVYPWAEDVDFERRPYDSELEEIMQKSV